MSGNKGGENVTWFRSRLPPHTHTPIPTSMNSLFDGVLTLPLERQATGITEGKSLDLRWEGSLPWKVFPLWVCPCWCLLTHQLASINFDCFAGLQHLVSQVTYVEMNFKHKGHMNVLFLESETTPGPSCFSDTDAKKSGSHSNSSTQHPPSVPATPSPDFG